VKNLIKYTLLNVIYKYANIKLVFFTPIKRKAGRLQKQEGQFARQAVDE